jgi:hypothetical protein
MAIYEGARRPLSLPLGLDGLARGGRGAKAGSQRARGGKQPGKQAPTGRVRAAGARRPARSVAVRRPPIVGIALAAIVLVFGAAFLSLSQSVRVAATGYDIVRLVSEQDRLQAIRQDLQSDVQRLRSEPAIRKEALDAGLGQLGAPLVIPAR